MYLIRMQKGEIHTTTTKPPGVTIVEWRDVDEIIANKNLETARNKENCRCKRAIDRDDGDDDED